MRLLDPREGLEFATNMLTHRRVRHAADPGDLLLDDLNRLTVDKEARGKHAEDPAGHEAEKKTNHFILGVTACVPIDAWRAITRRCARMVEFDPQARRDRTNASGARVVTMVGKWSKWARIAARRLVARCARIRSWNRAPHRTSVTCPQRAPSRNTPSPSPSKKTISP